MTSTTIVTPTSETVHLNNTDLCVHTWTPPASSDAATTNSAGTRGALVVIYHGFLAHGLYPTVRYAAELLCCQGGCTVVCADFRGHGQSPGLTGYLASRELAVADGIAVARYAKSTVWQNAPATTNGDDDANNKNSTVNVEPKCFLLGSSMGGTIALSVAQHMKKEEIAGVVLLAPMLKLSVGPMSRALLKTLSYIAPVLQVIPSSSTDAAKQYRDPVKRLECGQGSYNTNHPDSATSNSSSIRIGSASTCVELATCIQDDFDKITTPFLIMVADEDVVVDIQGDLDLFEKAPAPDKTMKRYPALHGLLCEPEPLVNEIHRDLLNWIVARS
jgi:acylglycerol lipase